MSTGNEPPVPAEDDTPGPATGTPSPLHGKNRARDGNGHFERSVETVTRDARAAELRAQGWKLQEIADHLGYTDRTCARRGIQRALRDIIQGPAEKLLALHMDRVESLYERAVEISERRHVVVSHGKVITMTDPDTGEEHPLRDSGPELAALREARAALESFWKLTGIAKPVKVEHSGVRYEIVGVSPEELT